MGQTNFDDLCSLNNGRLSQKKRLQKLLHELNFSQLVVISRFLFQKGYFVLRLSDLIQNIHHRSYLYDWIELALIIGS